MARSGVRFCTCNMVGVKVNLIVYVLEFRTQEREIS